MAECGEEPLQGPLETWRKTGLEQGGRTDIQSKGLKHNTKTSGFMIIWRITLELRRILQNT